MKSHTWRLDHRRDAIVHSAVILAMLEKLIVEGTWYTSSENEAHWEGVLSGRKERSWESVNRKPVVEERVDVVMSDIVVLRS